MTKKLDGYTFQFGKELGSGAMGSVYLGRQDGTNRECAIKVINKSKIKELSQYLERAIHTEIKILQQVKSKNIVQIYDFKESEEQYYIIQQFCDSDLSKYINSNPNISEAKALEILKQIVNGFVTLVKEGIIHRDLKPQNILLSKGQVKIADFGFSKMNTTQKIQNWSYVGTPLYMALQNLKGEPYTSKCDVWALGCIFYQLLHNKTPWEASSIFNLIKQIQTKPLVINQKINPKIKDFIQKSLAIQEERRISWDDVFGHPIFQKQFFIYFQNNKKIEDKLKVFMNDLRFRINSQNIDIQELLNKLVYTKECKQLNLIEFAQFIRVLDPTINDEEIRYFFSRINEDNNKKGKGSIPVQQITFIMNKYQISGILPKKKKTQVQFAQKVKDIFTKLHKNMEYKHINLRQIFDSYDKNKKGKISFADFKTMITRMLPKMQITQQDFILIFTRIENTESGKEYYCKLNNLLPYNN